jgi:hypothetical protein
MRRCISDIIDGTRHLGAGSVAQHMIAHGGSTNPPLFKRAITSSLFLPSQYNYNDRIPEVSYEMLKLIISIDNNMFQVNIFKRC